MVEVTILAELPEKRPNGILSNIYLALTGSDQPIFPISVITTVGFTVFTLI